MDKRFSGRYMVFLLAAVTAVILSSCSVVFQAGISGKIVTPSGTGTAAVENVNVFVYTNKDLRDSDLEAFKAGIITRPSSGSGYVATTSTNVNGEFTVNKVVWETKSSKFGKTADVNKFYLIFYHKDYIPESADATVISDSTNSNNVYKEIQPGKDYTTITVTVYNVSTGRAMTEACTLEYKLSVNESSDTVTITGQGGVEVSFRKSAAPDINFILTNPGTKWKMTDKDGKAIESYTKKEIAEGTLSVKLYMKNYEFTVPSFSGNLDLTDDVTIGTASTNADDNLPVWLEYQDTNSLWHIMGEADMNNKTYSRQTASGNNIFHTHGLFSNVGSSDNHSIVVNEDEYPNITDWNAFTGKNLSVKFRVVFQMPDTTRKAYEFTYSAGMTGSDLGHVVPSAI